MWKLSLGAVALLCAAPAMAEDFGCWDTDAISANGSPSGTYLNGASSVDYIQPMHEGVDALLGDLSEFTAASFVVCMYGEDGGAYGGDDIWNVQAAIICSMGSYSAGECPG